MSAAASRTNAVQARKARTAIAAERYARYVQLSRAWSNAAIASDLGISERQTRRYRARRRGERGS